MQIRICAKNQGGNAKGLPTPAVDLIFAKESKARARMYIAEPGATIPRYGPRPAYLLVNIADLCAVAAALQEVTKFTGGVTAEDITRITRQMVRPVALDK